MYNQNHLCSISLNHMPLVEDVGKGIIMKPFPHSDRIAPFHVLIYLVEGEMEIIEDGTVYELKEGSLFFLKSGVHHWGNRPFQKGSKWYYIHFYSNISESPTIVDPSIPINTARALDIHTYDCQFLLPKHITISSRKTFENTLENLIEAFDSGHILSIHKAMIHVLEECLNQKNRIYKSINELRVSQVCQYIDYNYAKNYSSEDIERLIGLSYKYISSIFKEKMNITIKDYQLKQQMKAASKLLTESQMSIKQIADNTGFYDTFHFSKTFKKYYNMTPTQFRSNHTPKI